MTEETEKYKPRGELRFVRLRFIPDDILGYVNYGDGRITIELPLIIQIETLFDEGRQIFAMHEYLPQAVVDVKEVEFKMDDIQFITPVKEEFVGQYESVSNFFYNNQHKLNTKGAISGEEASHVAEKVVSILEALQSKKDKPVH